MAHSAVLSRSVLTATRQTVAQGDSERMENASKEMERLLKQVAAPAQPGESVPQVISRVARRLGWERGRTKRLWYGEARRIDAEEMDAVRAYLDRHALDKARGELAQNDELIERIAALLVQDPDFHRVQVAEFLKALGRRDSPVDSQPD